LHKLVDYIELSRKGKYTAKIHNINTVHNYTIILIA